MQGNFCREYALKVVHIILNNRIQWDQGLKKRVTNNWFQIEVEQFVGISEQIEKLLAGTAEDNSTSTSIFVDVYAEILSKNKDKKYILLERWKIEIVGGGCTRTTTPGRNGVVDNNTIKNKELSVAYRKGIVLMRSLFTHIILLPAHSIFKELGGIMHNKSHHIKLGFFIFGKEPKINAFENGSTNSLKFDTIILNKKSEIRLSAKYRKDITFMLKTIKKQNLSSIIVNNFFEDRSVPQVEYIEERSSINNNFIFGNRPDFYEPISPVRLTQQSLDGNKYQNLLFVAEDEDLKNSLDRKQFQNLLFVAKGKEEEDLENSLDIFLAKLEVQKVKINALCENMS